MHKDLKDKKSFFEEDLVYNNGYLNILEKEQEETFNIRKYNKKLLCNSKEKLISKKKKTKYTYN